MCNQFTHSVINYGLFSASGFLYRLMNEKLRVLTCIICHFETTPKSIG